MLALMLGLRLVPMLVRLLVPGLGLGLSCGRQLPPVREVRPAWPVRPPQAKAATPLVSPARPGSRPLSEPAR